MLRALSIIVRLAWDLIQWGGLLFRPRESLEAEILFLRRQLALYRIAVETGPSSVTTDRGKVHASARSGTAARRSTMVDFPSRSRTGHHYVRFLCRGDQHVPVLYVLVVIEHHSR